MSNFLTTLKAHMEACESAPSSGHEHMAFWLADHAAAIIGCVEALELAERELQCTFQSRITPECPCAACRVRRALAALEGGK